MWIQFCLKITSVLIFNMNIYNRIFLYQYFKFFDLIYIYMESNLYVYLIHEYLYENKFINF